MYKDYLEDVYKDFYGEEEGEKKYIENKEEANKEVPIEEIDKLLITDESKELLHKILDYMSKYSKEEEKRYLNFHLLIESNNKETINIIEEIIKSFVSKYKYVKNNDSKEISFYELQDVDSMMEVFEKNSVIVLKDIKGIDLKDNEFQKKFFHLLEDNISDHNIILLEGNKEEIDHFFEFDNSLREKFFPFLIEGINPDVQDIYNEVLEIVNENKKFDDDFCIKILDYISNTFNKSEYDYPTYRDTLCRELLFKGELPKIESEKSIDEIFADLNELVGLSKVKKTLHELVDYMSLRKKETDLKLNNVNLHMVFLGNPGTGKTTVARLISDILYNLGYIKQNKLIEVTTKDLVAEYVGQTAPKTMSVVERAMGGILFIDEAYALASKNNQNSYNAEAIATLIKAMEDYRDNLVVIFAGYTKEMQDFLDSNSGIVSRIGYTFEFDDYTEDELVEIFIGMMKKAGFEVEEEALLYLREIIKKNKDMKNFGNARFIRNIYEKSIIKHAFNTKDKKQRKILRTITKEDISIENLNIVDI